MSHDRQRPGSDPSSSPVAPSPSPSRAGAGRTLPRTTAQLARWTQRRAAPAPAPVEGAAQPAPDPLAIADEGVRGSPGTLPFVDEIQGAFGHHDVRGIGAHVGGAAAEASGALGAHAYATGDQVAFAQAPDLHLAAHEAAHVVQQRAGVQLSSAVGEAGDAYEQHADRVADAVVRGESAAPILDQMAGGGGGGGAAVQRKEDGEGGGGWAGMIERVRTSETNFLALPAHERLDVLRGADPAERVAMLDKLAPEQAEPLIEQLRLRPSERSRLYLALSPGHLHQLRAVFAADLLARTATPSRADAQRLFQLMTIGQRMQVCVFADAAALAHAWPSVGSQDAQTHAAMLNNVDDAKLTSLFEQMDRGAAMELYEWLPGYVADRVRALAPGELQVAFASRGGRDGDADAVDVDNDREKADAAAWSVKGDPRRDARMSPEQVRVAVTGGQSPVRFAAAYAHWKPDRRVAAMSVASPAQLAGLLDRGTEDSVNGMWNDVVDYAPEDVVRAALRRLDATQLGILHHQLEPAERAALRRLVPPERAALLDDAPAEEST